MKKLIAILLCLVMVVSMVACGGEKNPPRTDEKVITIGVFDPPPARTAPAAKKRSSASSTPILCIPPLPLAVRNTKSSLTYADNQSDSSKAPTAAQQLVSKGVTAVLGTYGSSCAIAGGPYLSRPRSRRSEPPAPIPRLPRAMTITSESASSIPSRA